MHTGQTGLVGDQDAGKTCLFGGIYAKYSAPQAFPSLEQHHLAKSLSNGWEHQVGFHINGFTYSADQKKLDGIARLLRTRPNITYPPRTTFSDHFPMDVTFSSVNLKSNTRSSSDRKVSIIDIPGGHLRDDYPDKTTQAETRKRLLSCNALIVVIDVLETDANSAIVSNLGRVIQDTADESFQRGSLIPVSILFSKFDKVKPEKQKEAIEYMFDKYALELSGYSNKIFAMACPISICDAGANRFRAYNLQFPFLFSAMGMIFSKHVGLQNKATEAQRYADETRELRSTNPWERFKLFLREGRTIGSREREATRMGSAAVKEFTLARHIFEYLCIEETLGISHLRFAQDGEAKRLPEIGWHI